ncbi:MAG: FkbM family methyltransferase [Candidatus Kapabacteria bacterium]|nr:FkbM family methyltransferase [Candidatus Kapabacteria bacterium]MBX7154114.1 FkbM family methyltransferase [Bacteroidota bacterium]
MTLLFKKLQTKNLHVHHVCEVGVYLPQTSNVLDFIKNGVKATLVEADPEVAKQVETYFSEYSVCVIPCAVWDKAGTLTLSRAASSTFATELQQSPALVNDKYIINNANTFEVECKLFSDIDDGTIDILSIDIEGGEWFVLKHMVSTPKIISIETHGKFYKNPYIKEIQNWLLEHQYQEWYKDKSDTVYVHIGVFDVSIYDRINVLLQNIQLSMLQLKRMFR